MTFVISAGELAATKVAGMIKMIINKIIMGRYRSLFVFIVLLLYRAYLSLLLKLAHISVKTMVKNLEVTSRCPASYFPLYKQSDKRGLKILWNS